jgi:hypothetical protein
VAQTGYVLHKNGDELVIELSRSINEDFADIATNDFDGYKLIIVDFDKVTMINSAGIREWILFIKSLSGKKITYRNCRKIIVDQMNYINDFLNKHIRVENIYVPYYCSNCDIEEMKLFDLKEIVIEERISLLDVICPSCKQSMEFDELEGQYFSFISKLKIKKK